MNLDNQKIVGEDELHVTDSLNAPILNMKLTVTNDTIIPQSEELIIYVDSVSKNESPSQARKEYIFNLSGAMNLSEEFNVKPKFDGNVMMRAIVNRNNEMDEEEVDYLPIILFEGENYIYTNYPNITINIEYPKNTDFNRSYLSSAIYYIHSKNATGDFSLEDIYFKDAFTDTLNGLDLEINNLNVNAISSNNNNFCLDSEGNLVVKTLTTTNQENLPSLAEIISTIYPIGSIYMSVSDINPSNLFGGVWQAWGNGKCIVGVDSQQNEFNTVEKTGGEKTHTLLIDELPSHNHVIGAGNHKHTYTGFINVTATNSTTYQCIAHKRYAADGENTPPSMNSSGSHTHSISKTGSGVAHNNLQPYITCYMWKRIG